MTHPNLKAALEDAARRPLRDFRKEELRDELQLRGRLARHGRCTYCERPIDDRKPCPAAPHDGTQPEDVLGRAMLEEAERSAQLLGRTIADELPQGWMFLLVLASVGDNGFSTYLSNIERASAIDLFEETVRRMRTGDGLV